MSNKNPQLEYHKVLNRFLGSPVPEVQFYAALLLRLAPIWTSTVETAAVDGANHLFINPDFFLSISPEERFFLLAHEVGHIAQGHARRGTKAEDKELWNTACDAVINEPLAVANVPAMRPIPGAVFLPNAASSSAEQLYQELLRGKNQSNQPNQPNQPNQSNQPNQPQTPQPNLDLMPGNAMPDEDGEPDPANPAPITPQEAARLDAETSVMVSEASLVAQARAKALGHSVDAVRDISRTALYRPVPWNDALADFMNSLASSDHTWRRPNRRYISNGIYLPTLRSENAMGPMVIAVDTSGSVSDSDLAEFTGHIKDILEMVTPEKITVLYCDEEINGIEEFEPDAYSNLTLTPHGGGCTAFQPVFDYVAAGCQQPDLLIYITDGEGDWDTMRQAHPGYPVVWASTYRTEGFPFGRLLSLRDRG